MTIAMLLQKLADCQKRLRAILLSRGIFGVSEDNLPTLVEKVLLIEGNGGSGGEKVNIIPIEIIPIEINTPTTMINLDIKPVTPGLTLSIQKQWFNWVNVGLPQSKIINMATWVENTGGTSLSSSIQTTIGKTVIAVVTTRSNTTFSSGWTVVSSVLNFSTSPQNLYVLIKTAENLTESITVTQSSSARIYIQLLSFKETIRLIELWRYSTGSLDNQSSISPPNKEVNEQILWALSANIWSTSTPYGHWETTPNDLYRYSAATDVQARQAVFIDDGQGSAINRMFNPQSTSTGIGALMMKIDNKLVTKININMASNTTPYPFVVSSSSIYNTNYDSFYAFNGNLQIRSAPGDAWDSASGTFDQVTGIGYAWIAIDLGKNTKLDLYRIYNRFASAAINEDISDFTFEGSDDNISWDIIDDVKGRNIGEPGSYTEHALAYSVNYRFYRVVVTKIRPRNGGTFCAIGQIELLYYI